MCQTGGGGEVGGGWVTVLDFYLSEVLIVETAETEVTRGQWAPPYVGHELQMPSIVTAKVCLISDLQTPAGSTHSDTHSQSVASSLPTKAPPSSAS